MSVHISQETLEKYHLEPGAMDSGSLVQIEEHLRQCAGCRERSEALRRFYADLDGLLGAGPDTRDEEFAKKLASAPKHSWIALPERGLSEKRKTGTFREVIERVAEIIEPGRRPIIERLALYARLHPLRSLTAVTGVIAAIVLSLVFLRVARDTAADHFMVKDRILSVMNKEGEVLWTRHLPGVRDGANEDFDSQTAPGARSIGIEDIDGNGRKVILTFATSAFVQDTLFCYEGDGRLRWAAWAGAPIGFGKLDFTRQAQMNFYNFAVSKGHPGVRPRLFAVMTSSQYFPSKLAELDPANGNELGTYWHAGGIEKARPLSPNGDGREELLIGGFNELYGAAFVALLDCSAISGCGPVPEEDMPASQAHGREEFYLLFPITDLGKALSPEPFNMVRGIVPGAHPYFQVYINEGRKDSSSLFMSVVYTLDTSMHVIAAAVGNSFQKTHAEYVAKGELSLPCDRAYKDSLVASVLYWDGERFVKKYVANRRFSGQLSRLP
jgi:hypothetical protein